MVSTRKTYFGYVRVSSVKQGEGVSLQEQRAAIEAYAERHGLEIADWHEEIVTAAKEGRAAFTRMMGELKRGRAAGVIIHKIDRGARNLRDWADLGALIDRGIEVHFSHESLDLHTRGGRLSADIQAVVAADYVRNLREETRKGFYGRLKQGLYPMGAPLGYLDCGKGQPKIHAPDIAPLVRQAFELYATGRHTLHTLRDELTKRGLRNRRGGQISINGLSVLLNNPFYMGVIRIKKTGETFSGIHAPIVSPYLFNRVHDILEGKTNARPPTHDYAYRRLFTCLSCGYTVIGERQKGIVYYRCHTRGCAGACVREDVVEAAISGALSDIQLDEPEFQEMVECLGSLKSHWQATQERVRDAARLQLKAVEQRLNRLTDAFVDGLVDRDAYNERRQDLLARREELRNASSSADKDADHVVDKARKFLEQAKTVYSSYILADPKDKRDFLKAATSNRLASGKNVEIALVSPYSELKNRPSFPSGAPHRDRPRTFPREAIEKIVSWFERQDRSGP
jgi:DNA invertase Pin-like site-specific DNA recombinase